MCSPYLYFCQVGRNSLENTLLKYSAKDHFFKAAICHFCIGAEDAKVSRGKEEGGEEGWGGMEGGGERGEGEVGGGRGRRGNEGGKMGNGRGRSTLKGRTYSTCMCTVT